MESTYDGSRAWVQENHTGAIFQELRSILRDAKDRKVIKDIAIDQLASLLVGGVLVYFTANPEISNNTDAKDLDRISAEYTDLVFDLLLDGICSKEKQALALLGTDDRAVIRQRRAHIGKRELPVARDGLRIAMGPAPLHRPERIACRIQPVGHTGIASRDDHPQNAVAIGPRACASLRLRWLLVQSVVS